MTVGFMPSAVGFLRSDVSGTNQPRDELRIHAAARRTGYDLRKTIVFSARTDEPMHRLRVAVDRLGVDAIIVPSIEHFDDHLVPAQLLEVAVVITASPGNTWARTRCTST